MARLVICAFNLLLLIIIFCIKKVIYVFVLLIKTNPHVVAVAVAEMCLLLNLELVK